MPKKKQKQSELTVVTYEWPGQTSGSAIALESSLRIYLRYFDEITFIAITDLPMDVKLSQLFPRVKFVSIEIKISSPSVRFVRNGFSHWPAWSYYFRSKYVIAKVDEELALRSFDTQKTVIFEQIAPSVLMHLCKNIDDSDAVCVRSFDVMQTAFKGVDSSSNLIVKLAWRYEISRIRRLENKSLRLASKVWSITDVDCDEYRRLGINVSGTLGVAIDTEKFDTVSQGARLSVVYLGSFDIRKQSGLGLLLHEVWPRVRHRVPEAELHLGGKGSNSFHNPSLGIFSHGFVENENELLSVGTVFVNPQITGSGVKLKSLNAMAAGKILFSFENGIRGIEAEADVHFVLCSSADEMFEKLVRYFEGSNRWCNLSSNAREFVRANYSLNALESECSASLLDLSADRRGNE